MDGNKFRDETILMATDDIIPKNIGWSQKPILCKTDSPEKNQVKVILKGMCSESFIDTEFFLDRVPMNNNPNDQLSFYYQLSNTS